jgi:hypothetical protein
LRHFLPQASGRSGAEYRRLRAEKVAKAEEEAKRKAALLAWVTERKLEREAAEQRAAERKANGERLTYDQWRAEVTGE